MARYQAGVAYDGTDLWGFQRQAVGRTVQGELESALSRLGWSGQSIWGAGRTDTGVHAVGQVVVFELEWRHSLAALLSALNANLPHDIAVQTVSECAPDFHPRYRARGRRYRYTIYNAPVRSPLYERYAWQVGPQRLDGAALQAASALLVGRHDFATFGTDPDQGNNTVRTVSQALWQADPAEPLWYFDIQAEAFLYRMVRGLVGALKWVGEGALSVAGFEARLAARDRHQCPPLAPPQGLCLMEVLY